MKRLLTLLGFSLALWAQLPAVPLPCLGPGGASANCPNAYVASATVTAAASGTDIAVITGQATAPVHLTSIRVSCTQTTAGIFTLYIIKRSTADTSGTSSNMTAVPVNSGESAANSTPKIYTVNPTTGTAVGDLDVNNLGAMATAATSPNDIYISPAEWRANPIVLKTTSEQVAVNLNGTTPSGLSCAVTFSWIEY